LGLPYASTDLVRGRGRYARDGEGKTLQEVKGTSFVTLNSIREERDLSITLKMS